MNKKSPPDNPKQNATSRTRKETVLKVFISTLICLWMFILGILVGRGTAPIRFDVQRLQEELATLKAAAVKQTTQRYTIAFQELDKQVDLGFHEALKNPKEDFASSALSLSASVDSKATGKTDPHPKETTDNVAKKAKTAGFQKNPPADTPKPWVIQVAATQEKTYGTQVMENLKKLGFRAYLTEASVPGKGTWYRIRVGGYASQAEAGGDLERLKREQFSPMIISP